MILESNPICFESVNVSGERGKAKISWQVPARPPLYYHVRYGPAESKGVAPFVTWQLAAKREIRVDGSLSSFSLDIPEDEDFGVQVHIRKSQKLSNSISGLRDLVQKTKATKVWSDSSDSIPMFQLQGIT